MFRPGVRPIGPTGGEPPIAVDADFDAALGAESHGNCTGHRDAQRGEYRQQVRLLASPRRSQERYRAGEAENESGPTDT